MRVNRNMPTRKASTFGGYRVTWPFIKAIARFLSLDPAGIERAGAAAVAPGAAKDAGALTPELADMRLSEVLAMGEAATDAVQYYKSVQDELRTDILKILEGGSAELELREVVRKIEAMGFTNHLVIWRWESKARKWLSGPMKKICSISQPFEIKGEKLFVAEAPRATSERELHYWCLYQSLKTGEFSRLRKCPHCAKIFVPEDPKRKFCSAGCKDTYNNERRRKEGYFASNKRRRKELDLKAKRLMEQGESLHSVQKRTGLSRMALERILERID